MSEEKREDHASFGVVGINHVSSTGARLNGSEFQHHHFVALTIKRAQKVRDLSREWWSGREELIAVWLSEAQFVELIGRPNMGDGVPCTISRVQGQQMPPAPEPASMRERSREDFQEYADQCVQDLAAAEGELEAAIESGKIGKSALRDIAKKMKAAGLAISNGLPFVAEQFEAQMETVVNHAAAEIEATVAQTAIRLGIEEMKRLASTAPRMIDGPSPDGVWRTSDEQTT